MDASEIYSKRLNAKEVIFPKQWEFIFPIADGRIKTPGGDQDLRTSTSIRDRPIRGESHVDFLGESEGSLPPPHDSFPDAGEAMNDFWSMSGNFIYRRHVEPRVKLHSLREESFTVPLIYIEIHWRNQNYSYEFGCQVRETYRWLLKYRWVKRFVWFMDRFQSIYSIGRKTSRRIFVVRGEIDEKTADIQARSFKARTLGEWERMPSWRRSKSGLRKRFILKTHENCVGSISLTPRTWNLRKPSSLLCPVKLWKIVGVVHPTKLYKSCVHSRRWWIYETAYGKFDTALSSRPYCRQRRQCITPLQFGSQIYSLASSHEIPASKAVVDKEWEKLEKISA